MRRSVVTALVLTLSLSMLAACGSDDPEAGGGDTTAESPAEATAPADYMEGLCAAIVSFQTDLESESASLEDSFSGDTPTAEESKTVLGTFLGTLADRTEQLLDEVDALGTPDVGNGEDVKTALTTAFEQVVVLFRDARSEIEGLSTEDPAALAEGFATAGTKLQEAATGITAPFDDLSSPELDEAGADAPSCAGVI